MLRMVEGRLKVNAKKKDVKASASIVVINALVNDPRLSQVANVANARLDACWYIGFFFSMLSAALYWFHPFCP